jgi:signal transduction histidine kinase
MASSDLQDRLTFLNLKDTDLVLLRELRPSVEEQADELVAAFYRHLLAFPATRRYLRDPEVKERLLGLQRQYLLSLTPPALDTAYFEERRRIGAAHERVGLELRWYIGAYSLYLSLLTPLIQRVYAHDAAKAQGCIGAIQKVLFLDAQIAMDAYVERHGRELEYLMQELSTEGRRLARNYEDQKAELRSTEDRARAAEALASVGTLVAGLAHEIGTPMGVIQGHAKLLEGAVSGESAEWRLQTIQEQIGRISKIIETLLNMARPRRTRRLPVDLTPLLDNSLSFLREKLGRRGIEVEKNLGSAPCISGDAERLQQLFLNLLFNAADAMPEGGRLRVELSGSEDGWVEIRVADTGVGISSDVLGEIFEPFFTTKAAGAGYGLGLVVAEGVVTDHRGTIEVESSEGKGTTFTMRFPVPEAGDGGSS